jgi:hypothetical protein
MTGAQIEPGDLLYIRTNVPPEQANGRIVVCRYGDFEFVKRLNVAPDGSVSFASDRRSRRTSSCRPRRPKCSRSTVLSCRDSRRFDGHSREDAITVSFFHPRPSADKRHSAK